MTNNRLATGRLRAVLIFGFMQEQHGPYLT
jgi:hypothetical protein